MVRVLLVIVYWLAKSAVAAVRVTLTVPKPVKVPAPEMISAAAGVKVAPEFTVKVVTTEKLPLEVTLAELAMVRLLKARVPELAILAPLFRVMVPADGAKTALEPTVKAAPTEKLAEVVTVAELAMVRL